MQIPLVGTVTRDERFDWLYSAPLPLKIFGNKEVRLVLEGYEEDENKQDFHAAISTFLSIDADALRMAEPHVLSYYRDMNGYWAPRTKGTSASTRRYTCLLSATVIGSQSTAYSSSSRPLQSARPVCSVA